MTDNALIPKPTVQPTEIVNRLQSGQRLRVNGCRGNAIIICHRHHSELAGPGAAVGGVFDLDCDRVIPVGKISIVYPQSRLERHNSYILRQKWILFTQKAMESYVPLQRAKNLLILLEKYFEPQLIDPLSDEILAQLVGVLPKTIGAVRQSLKSRQEQKLHKLHPVISKY
ncbi:MAG: hypothetical protein F6K58_04745 [Symploca sp. SIO2E9]|nr:hypothetical protein [Symploca sp. SIO2E9]